ncbi:hypothetical protein WA158_002187 [Blastocystis sp. Blastoise]
MELSKISKNGLIKLLEEIKDQVNPQVLSTAYNKISQEYQLEGPSPNKRPMEVSTDMTPENSGKKVKKNRPFDFSRYHQRHVAFHVLYDGSSYQGFADQQVTEENKNSNYIERELFKAFQKVKLIEDRNTCNYSRSGRTDAGVSAFGQVISINVRSNLRSNVEFVDDNQENETNPQSTDNSRGNIDIQKKNQDIIQTLEELDYPCILNKVLPADIRIDGWCPVPREFDARFSCKSRVYRYFFIKRNLDIEKMNDGCQYFIGEHDFRNVCKIDIINVHHFIRTILLAHIITIREDPLYPEESVMAFEIEGRGFLWHQVRCMVALLFHVGAGKEEPELIESLLDIQKHPEKPHYMMADPSPLCLFECKYDLKECNFENTLSEKARLDLLLHYENRWATSALNHIRLEDPLKRLIQQTKTLYPGPPAFYTPPIDYKYIFRNHQPILSRKTEISYEDKIRNLTGASLEKLEKQINKKPLSSQQILPDILKEKLNISPRNCDEDDE